MLSRSSSDAGTRLRRSKSASTVQRHPQVAPEPFYHYVAQQHAVAAATTAFARSHGHAAVERPVKHSLGLSRPKSMSSRKSLASEGSHFPPRQGSVRSVHVPKTTGPSSIQRESQASTLTLEKFPSFYPTPASTNERPSSAQPSIPLHENIRPNSQNRQHRSSVTSSITSQQIRKARSMYYASSVQTGSPIARPPAKYLATPPPVCVSPSPNRLTPALPIQSVAPSPLASSRMPIRVERGDTIDDARDRYLQSFQQQQLQVKHKPSLFLAPFKKRQDRSKIKERPLSAGFISVRSGSRQTRTEPTIDIFDEFGMPKQKKEKRSISNSIKDKLKRVFRRTSNNEQKPSEYTMPAQQLDASRDYFNYEAPPATVSNRTLDIPSPDDETLLRARSRGSSTERMPSPFVRPESRGSIRSKGSNKSLHSEANATHSSSRVTSWNDSSAGNTLTQRDMKRLTVIHESKDSISSDADRSISSISLRRKTVPLPSFSTFKDPMPMESLLEETSTPVDPKRVFSALIREMDTAKCHITNPSSSNISPGAKSDVFESSATKELHAMSSRELFSRSSNDCRTSTSSDQRPVSRRRPNTAQGKTSSIRSLSKVFKSTIRTVTPIDHKSSPIPEKKRTDVTPRLKRPQSRGSTRSGYPHTGADVIQDKTREIQNTAEESQIPTIVTPSAKQLEQRMLRSKERWKAPLDENQHHGPLHHRSHARVFSVSQHGDSAICTPATVVGIAPLPELEGDSPKETMPTELRGTPVNTLLRSPRPNAVLSPLSPSVYSRNTDGASILPNDSVMSFDGTDDGYQSHQDAGSAVIITSHAVKSYVIGTPSPRHKTDSIRSSKDWKAWLSHEVSELGSSIEGDMTIHQGYTPSARNLSPSRHHRELAEIEDGRSTLKARTTISTRGPSPQLDAAEAILQQSAILKECYLPHNADTARKWNGSAAQESGFQKRAVLPVVQSPVIREGRQSSARSRRSAQSRSSANTPRSMNDRFPFIDTGRRTSIMSARHSRSSRSGTDSGSSTGSKGTPTSKVYSDLSAPVTVNWAPQNTSHNTPQTVRESNESSPIQNDSLEHAIIATTNVKRPESKQSGATCPSPIDTKENRYKVPSNSSGRISQVISPPKQNVTVTENIRFPKNTITEAVKPISPSNSPRRQRMRATMSPLSPTKLIMRPKSAFELRSQGALPMASDMLSFQRINEGPTKNAAEKRGERAMDPLRMSAPMCSNAIDQDTLHMLLEAPWAISGSPSSPRSSLEVTDPSRIGPRLHIKHSSSTLALHREPSPGLEEQTIDTILDERALSRRGNFGSVYNDEVNNVTGRTTPGQRMAERFLRERTVPRGSGAGTPCSEVEHEQGIARIGVVVEREDTPAFL